MVNKVRTYIEQYNMLSMGDRVVVGVSGGADSICLFHVLLDLSGEYDLTLYVVHVNHGIRGVQADSDEAFVEELCKKHNASFFCVNKDVPAIAKEQGLSEEEAGRNVRYEAFYKFYNEMDLDKIAVAHNKNDNAETFLFNLFRGSGIKGLSGIPPVRNEVIRPILCLERSEIESYLEERKIPYIIDSSNLTDDYSRNKIRNNILTYAKEEINAGLIEHITKSANMLSEIDNYILGNVNKAYEDIVREDFMLNLPKENENKEICISIDEFNKLDIVIQKELLRKIIKSLSSKLKDIDSSHIQSILELASKQVGKEIHLPYEITVIKGYNDIVFSKVNKKVNMQVNKISSREAYQNKDDFKSISIKISSSTSLPQINGNIYTKLIPYKDHMTIPKEGYTKWFDYDKIKNNLLFRTRQEGDFLQIDSKGGTKKIKSLFIDEKIPKNNRNSIHLIADGSHIVWVIGMRISEAYKVTKNTKTILEMSIYGGYDNGKDNRR